MEGSDAEDVDLDEVLEEYRRQQEQFLKITETVCDAPPRARAASTLMATPNDSNTLLLFGGEYFNGSLARLGPRAEVQEILNNNGFAPLNTTLAGAVYNAYLNTASPTAIRQGGTGGNCSGVPGA